jgi:cytochrome c oxidase subunit VIa
MPPLEERTEYPFQNIRVKNFPWGDGDKTLLYVPDSTLLSLRHKGLLTHTTQLEQERQLPQ